MPSPQKEKNKINKKNNASPRGFGPLTFGSLCSIVVL